MSSGDAFRTSERHRWPIVVLRIIVFTTNYKDKIDPALLRAGRMDKHICLSYSTACTFKQLAANYLGISHHDLFSRIEKIIEEINVSPAEVAGELMKSKDPKTCLEGLIELLESKVIHLQPIHVDVLSC